MDVQPIATYHESTVMGRRDYLLFEDHLKVIARLIHRTHADVRFDLSRMNVNYVRLWVRPGPFTWGLFAMFLGAFTYFSATSIDPDYQVRALEICGGIFAIGLIVSLLTFKKVEYVAFMESAAVTLWDIGKSGPDEKNFEEFINKVVTQIEKAKQKKQG